MRLPALLPLIALLTSASPAYAAWHSEEVALPGKLRAINAEAAAPRIETDLGWYQLAPDTLRLTRTDAPSIPALSPPALPDSQIAHSDGPVARAWLAVPTEIYQHGVFGHHYEAAELIIERRDGTRAVVLAGEDAVFEDLRPRIATLGGATRIVLVRSTLTGGAGLAVIDPQTAQIVVTSPVIGHPHAWIDPVGVADFQGLGTEQIAVVRQPHVVGALEFWAWRDGALVKTGQVEDTANHFFGSRAPGMSVVAELDGPQHPDIAIPSLDRRALRIIAMAPTAHDIARVRLPARASTDMALVSGGVLVGLEDGRLLVIKP